MLIIDNIHINIIRKKIKNFYLSVSPPNGEVQVSVPKNISEAKIHTLVTNKIDWIKKKQQKINQQPQKQQQDYQYINGEIHYFLGNPIVLNITEASGKAAVELSTEMVLQIKIPFNTTTTKKQQILCTWYKDCLTELIDKLVKKWLPIINKPLDCWKIRKMKARWGSCFPTKKTIILNLDLIKHPIECIEYVVVHELVHLHERFHNKRYYRLLSEYLPDWKQQKDKLNNSIIPH